MKNRQNYRLSCVFQALLGSAFFTTVGMAVSHSLVTLPLTSSIRLATHRLTTHRPVSPKAEQTDSDQQQRPAHIYAVSPEILAIEVAAPDVTLGRQIAYQPQPDDEVVNRKKRSHIKRNGQLIGILVGPKQDTLYTYDQVQETSFRADIADLAKHYEISSRNAPHYALAKSPVTLFRKTKPVALSQSSNGARQWPTAHTLYLTLPRAMTHGKTYQLKFSPDLGIENDSFTYQPQTARSEAIHISQLGFRPSDTFKAGYLSTWMGNGGGLDYADNLNFSLIDTHSNQTVYRSRAVRKRGEHQIEDPRDRDYTLSEVHQLDFSSFNQPGEYRLCVEGIGCSFDFEIQADVWDKAFYTSARGFYHQRSGLAIGPPHSEFQRPRAFHPADGLKVYQSNASLLEVDMGLGEADTFETLVANKTEVEVPNAWGGYFDAADWDRRIQHLTVPRHLLELHNLFPEHFQAINLNLPESNNALPDILDEALWSIDFFRRLQLPDGGIRGGVESAAHPKKGEASWQESLTVMAYAPGVWSSYLYAGVAARAATTLKAYDSQLSETYENSALQAMAYAEKNYRAADYIDGKKLHQVSDARNLTSLELYRLTQDTQWHDLFLETTAFSTAAAEVFSHTQHDQADAAFLYARLSPSDPNLPIDQPVQNHARAALLEQADEQVTLTKTSAFGWSRQAPDAPVGWRSGLGAPTGINVLRAHALTQEAHYLQAGISGTQFAAGANPANMVFTTGLGDRTPQNPLISDYRITRQDPPPGITLFGPADFDFYKDYWVIDRIAPVTFPHPSKWPTTENYFDIYSNPIHTEFTVQYMVAATYTWGYLSAREN